MHTLTVDECKVLKHLMGFQVEYRHPFFKYGLLVDLRCIQPCYHVIDLKCVHVCRLYPEFNEALYTQWRTHSMAANLQNPYHKL